MSEMFWYRRDISARLQSLLLLPLSWFYRLVISLRRLLYRAGVLRTIPPARPLIVVGNISVGGTGKTPFLIALARRIADRGLRPGVVSRGYGGEVDGVQLVSVDDDARIVGDEPLMIARRTGLPVVVGTDRAAAVRHLLDNAACDVVLSDDGLQHLRMGRSAEIVIVDGQRRFGNGLCLPAGPLREPISRLHSVDLVACNVAAGMVAGAGQQATQEHGFSLRPGELVNLLDASHRPLSGLQGSQVHAVAGIGNPARFFDTLAANGIEVEPHAYADHYAYTATDLAALQGKSVIMTEKDAVKCRDMIRQTGREDCWFLPVDAEFDDSLASAIDHMLDRLLPAPTDFRLGD